nr:reverse transcriptase domain-containing protein [Tanacetum cinerariifolium]
GLQLTHALCAESCNGSQFTMDSIQELASPEANGFWTLRNSSSGNTSTVQCYNCSGNGHYARNCPKPRVWDSKYSMEQMLLAKYDEVGFWNTAVVKRSGDVTRLQALVDKKRIVITEEVVREILQLNDAEGVICLPNDEIFAGLARMGYEKPSTKLTFYKAFFSTQWKFFIHTILHSLSAKRASWNEFSSAMASALICLSSGQRFNFSKYIFESLVRNVNNTSKFYMYPRVGKGFSGVETPLFENMLTVRAVDAEEEVQVPAQDDVVQEHVIEEIATEVLDKCSALVLRVEGLEIANSAKQLEIVKLKARVKKLERLNKVKSSKLRRLQKVGTSQRVESSEDVENVFNQGRISVDMETDEGIELEVDQEKNAEIEGRHADIQADIYNIDLDHSSKVLSMQEDIKVQEAVEVVTTAKLITEVVTAAATQVATASTPIHAAKPKILKIPAVAPAVSTKRRKGVVIRDPEEELHIDTPAETPTKAAKRRKLSEEAQEADNLRGRLEIVPDEDDDVFSIKKPINFLDEYLLLTLNTMFEELDEHDAIWRNQKSVHSLALVKRWKLLTSCGVHVIILSTVQLFLLVERRYPLSRFTLEQLVNVARLQAKVKAVQDAAAAAHTNPREILAIEKAGRSFEQPPRMIGSRRSRDMSKYCHFYEDYGHDTNECRQLRNQIEEAMKSGQISHLVKGIKKEKVKASKNQRTKGKKDKSTMPSKAPILMVRQDELYTKNKFEGLTSESKEIAFPSRGSNSSAPVVIKAKVFGRVVNRVHMDSESSCEVIYEHCFMKLKPSIRASKVDSKVPLIRFSREKSWYIGKIPLEITIGDPALTRKETLNFVIVKSDLPYNMLLGRTAM